MARQHSEARQQLSVVLGRLRGYFQPWLLGWWPMSSYPLLSPEDPYFMQAEIRLRVMMSQLDALRAQEQQPSVYKLMQDSEPNSKLISWQALADLLVVHHPGTATGRPRNPAPKTILEPVAKGIVPLAPHFGRDARQRAWLLPFSGCGDTAGGPIPWSYDSGSESAVSFGTPATGDGARPWAPAVSIGFAPFVPSGADAPRAPPGDRESQRDQAFGSGDQAILDAPEGMPPRPKPHLSELGKGLMCGLVELEDEDSLVVLLHLVIPAASVTDESVSLLQINPTDALVTDHTDDTSVNEAIERLAAQVPIKPPGIVGVVSYEDEDGREEHRMFAPPAPSSWADPMPLLVLILLALSPIAYYDFPAFLVVTSYLAALTFVQVRLQEVMDVGYPHPNTILAMHMLALCSVTSLFAKPRKEDALQVLPISMLNGLSLLTNSSAFLFGSVAFVSMIAANVPIVTLGLEQIKEKPGCNFAWLFFVGLVCAGSACCIQGPVHVSLAAFILATFSTVLRAARCLWQHELVSRHSPLHLAFWNGFWSGSISLLMMLLSEGLAGWRSLSTLSAEAQLRLWGSILSTVCLYIAQWFAMKALGPLMASIIGNLNLLVVIALSNERLHEQFTWEFLGATLLASGTFASSMCSALRPVKDATT
ncbi:unnamed protein product [Durusdinium trenchii]|uniref:Sugar phosphate transporter domain-containing protein n=1 Tax=Durusdinium trenchii TaxID=1381693 RepID=A0ABP0HQ17_9DINO